MKYNKIEFIIATCLFALFLVADINRGMILYGNRADIGEGPFGFFFPWLLIDGITYTTFLFINYLVAPLLFDKKKINTSIVFLLVNWVIASLILMVCQSYLRSWIYNTSPNAYSANVKFMSRGLTHATFLIGVCITYVLASRVLRQVYKTQSAAQTPAAKLKGDLVVLPAVWLIILVPIYLLKLDWFFLNFGTLYLFGLPLCLLIYIVNMHLLVPQYYRDKQMSAYILKLLASSALLSFIATMFMMQGRNNLSFAGFIVFVWLLPTLIVSSASWWIYSSRLKGYREVASLQTALGTSDANLQFLRSQINPHFLFNVLNTLYGTALMEQAEKTGEGIQKLGDMMRFMLHENNQDKISLARDIEYLRNYVALQNLRIAPSADIKITADIADVDDGLQIAPMLLIPFVENSYKHGISFKNPSHINISLQVENEVLLLDVTNSLQTRNDNDPESGKSGIGLENVKQRLQLLYPQKHELTIRQTTREFFVHLTLQLS
ncbi:histidine kinase [Mucilaginibacter pallidiroseus]|uniref:Histidine kinase n=1 Tax=Mucilaginibacter pallidiroseus TaxID=2599295 RepID=A0A563UFB3_9SPHI|nr:histidine kinase [Mucilaginibacter pallidiroseus]TWR29949.1 histidine kinase [Mucilaginibacter pallidiroseus]